MASRIRVIPASESIFVGPTPSTGQHLSSGNSGINWVSQLFRVQSANYGFNLDRQDVNQFGELGEIDRIMLNNPTVSLDFSWLIQGMHNERRLGFSVNGIEPAVSGLLNKTSDDKNYFIKVNEEGQDAKSNTTNNGNVKVFGFGNGFVTSYSAQASVGNLPTASVSVEARNMRITTGINEKIPAVNPADGTAVTSWNFLIPTASGSPGTGISGLSTLRPGDITLTILQREQEGVDDVSPATSTYSTMGTDISDAKIQGFNLSFNLSREAIQKLGSRFEVAREISFPVQASMSIDCIVGDLTTGSLLQDIVNCDDAYDIVVNMKKPADCNGISETPVVRYYLKNAKLDSQSFSSSIGSNKTATLNFSSQLSGPSQLGKGVFFSGLAVAPY